MLGRAACSLLAADSATCDRAVHHVVLGLLALRQSAESRLQINASR